MFAVQNWLDSIFQSTLPQGERQTVRPSSAGVFNISIHAPARGATKQITVCFLPDGDFNPRSRKGSDPGRALLLRRQQEFQSTLPQGERRAGDNINEQDLAFQSTLPQGERRGDKYRPSQAQRISIHAPARGATDIVLHLFYSSRFQSTLPQGERPSPSFTWPIASKFQSTLPQGERHRNQRHRPESD